MVPKDGAGVSSYGGHQLSFCGTSINVNVGFKTGELPRIS
jgi:hypothetical protein